MNTILVVGGAGYIGSHIVRDLSDNSHHVIVLDNLSEGHYEAISGHQFICEDIINETKLVEVFEENKIDLVMHFSAFAYVGESVTNPEKYYKNNVNATLNLLSVMLKYNVKKFIFSSSCATYGNPLYLPIDENHPQNPINPYGNTKFIVEKILSDYDNAYGIKSIALRYFNAAGAHPDKTIGESHRIETHLIPLILKTLTKEKKDIKIFGTDYPTEDGTCIRDYIHVCDLAVAHRNAMQFLLSENTSQFINIGTGTGFSVKEIIKACEEVTGLKVPVILAECRAGDPPILIALNNKAKTILGFEPKYTNIHDIIQTAWEWEKNKKY